MRLYALNHKKGCIETNVNNFTAYTKFYKDYDLVWLVVKTVN